MTVRELIETLEQYDQEAMVEVVYETYAQVPIRETQVHKATRYGRHQLVVQIITDS